tara:strand:- start:224 stop:493 length:270 start_codon:yes stop_codon:yes gene_type:complete
MTVSLTAEKGRCSATFTIIKERRLMSKLQSIRTRYEFSDNQRLKWKSQKYKTDPNFKINIGGWIWRRRLAKGSNGDYWDYFISNAKETK